MSKLMFAVPSKGRLKENCESYFSEAGFPLKAAAGSRGYAGEIPSAPGIDLQFRSASEIASLIVSGSVHVGVTGADLLHETMSAVDTAAFLLTPLGFGHADIVVAVPNAWLDVETMADLDDVAALQDMRTGRRLRVATKYLRQTRQFFDECGVGHYRIVESAGATEGLPASGDAEVVVDITTTGATLEGNGLRVLSDGVILKSQAWLCASLGADWTDEALGELEAMLRAMEAREAGQRNTIIEFDAGADIVSLLGNSLRVISPGVGICENKRAAELAQRMSEQGAGPVRLSRREFIFEDAGVRMSEFRAALEKSLGAAST